MASTTDPTLTYPLPKFHFQVQWGTGKMAFTEVTGLDFETEVIEYRHGLDPNYTKIKQPGLKKYSNVTAKRGTFLGDFDFYQYWRQTYYFQAQQKNFRTNIIIMLMNEQHKAVISWTLANAWASKIMATDLKADANEVAIESMELVHEGLTIVQAP